MSTLDPSVAARRLQHEVPAASDALRRLTTSTALAIVLVTGVPLLNTRAQTPAPASPEVPTQTPAAPAGQTLASSAGLMVYPSKGQSADQQAQDEAQCFSWARGQSGYDPMNPLRTARAPSTATESGGDVARGALGGAVVGAASGAVIGAIAGNAGKGAGIGAGAGLLMGGMHAHSEQEHREERAEAQAQASQEAQRAAQQELADKFKRGMAVCLEARGYATK